MNAPLRIYIAAPYCDAKRVRELHARIRGTEIECCSGWADGAFGPERLDEEAARLALLANDINLASADLVLVIARYAVGGEMFAEARAAWDAGKMIVWCGERQTLGAFRRGVVRCAGMSHEASIDIAISVLRVLSTWPAADRAGVFATFQNPQLKAAS